MSGKTARRARQKMAKETGAAKQGDFIQGFPPVNEGTVIFATGSANLPVRVALNYGGTTVVADLDSDGNGRALECFDGGPSLVDLGFGGVGGVEVILGTMTALTSAYSIGGGVLEALSMPAEYPGAANIDTLAQGLPEPTSLVVSNGFFSTLFERSGRISQYEHPRDEVVRFVSEFNEMGDNLSQLASTLEVRLCPQESPRLWFGDFLCDIDRNGFGTWYGKS